MMTELRRADTGIDSDQQHAQRRADDVAQRRKRAVYPAFLPNPPRLTYLTHPTYLTYFPARMFFPTWFTVSSSRRMFSPMMFFTSCSL